MTPVHWVGCWGGFSCLPLWCETAAWWKHFSQTSPLHSVITCLQIHLIRLYCRIPLHYQQAYHNTKKSKDFDKEVCSLMATYIVEIIKATLPLSLYQLCFILVQLSYYRIHKVTTYGDKIIMVTLKRHTWDCLLSEQHFTSPDAGIYNLIPGFAGYIQIRCIDSACIIFNRKGHYMQPPFQFLF